MSEPQDLKIIEWLIDQSDDIQWRDNDNQAGLFAIHNGIRLRLLVSEMIRNFLSLSDENGRQYVISDPQPVSLAPAGKFAAWCKREWRHFVLRQPLESPSDKLPEPTVEELIHLRLKDLNQLAVQQVIARYQRGNDEASSRRTLFYQLQHGKNTPDG